MSDNSDMYKPIEVTEEDKKWFKEKGFIKDKKNRSTHANICWYINNIKRETIHSNIPVRLAYALNNKLKKDPNYRVGEIKLEYI